MRRDHWLRRIEELDPETDHAEINRISSTLEFPWDVQQALSFALFRTYAVPSIGGLLARTGEFTQRTQKRYDDTVLLLDAVATDGLASERGRTAVRRMNQMHGRYGIGNDDLRYVLSTFVVVPKRWIDDYGWRRLSAHELRAAVTYYRALGQHMGIREIPETFEEFATLMDAYEREHFAGDPGARAVADATLDLLATFPVFRLLPRRITRALSRGLMDDPLLDALGYARSHPLVRALARGGLRVRARVVRLLPPRRTPVTVADLRQLRTYPGGYDVAQLGTFAANVR